MNLYAIGGGGIGDGAAGPKPSAAIIGGGGIGDGAAGPKLSLAIGGGGIGDGAAGPNAKVEVAGRSRTVTERIERTNSFVIKFSPDKFARCTRVSIFEMQFPIWKLLMPMTLDLKSEIFTTFFLIFVFFTLESPPEPARFPAANLRCSPPAGSCLHSKNGLQLF